MYLFGLHCAVDIFLQKNSLCTNLILFKVKLLREAVKKKKC